MTVATIDNGITAFMDDYHKLMNTYLPVIGCGSTDTDNILSKIIENSYINVINHIVKCEVMRITKIAIDRDMKITLKNSEAAVEIDTVTLNWAVSSITAIAINNIKVENQITAEPSVATAFLTLNNLMATGNPDMLEYIKARVTYIVTLITAAPPALAELETEIKRVKEAA